MTKKHFIALADEIKAHNRATTHNPTLHPFTPDQLEVIAYVCKRENSNFDRERWLGYIAGDNGPSGGTVKAK